MDRLDRISAAAAVILAVWALLLVVFVERQPPRRHQKEQQVVRVDPAFDKKVSLVKNLLAGNNLDQAEALLVEMVANYPYEAMPFFLRGDLLLYRQDAIGAMMEYRKAVDLNPDFLDKKSELFQGKKIKKTVEEARAMIEPGLAAKQDDGALLAARAVYYYMLRKIAGSCG